MREARPRLLLFALLLFATLIAAPTAQAKMPGIPESLTGSCQPQAVFDTGVAPYAPIGQSVLICDDGVPSFGGDVANEEGLRAVRVPAKYAPMVGGFGLPSIAPDAARMPGADKEGYVALDVDITMPDPASGGPPPPPGGYPLLVFMHGCCGGTEFILGANKKDWEKLANFPPTVNGNSQGDGYSEKWHYNNVWFATRGYVVINYTARGFVNGANEGSTGETQLDSRNFEIHDFQYLACEVAADPFVHIDPTKVVATGGSYGGGFSWLALTNPIWSCPGGAPSMKLAAVAPKWGWTDLINSLVPTGRHSTAPAQLPAFDASSSSIPTGIPKASVVNALYQNGKTGDPSGQGSADHTTFPPYIDDAASCLNSADPLETNPSCKNTFATVLPSFAHDRSAYYQNQWFAKIRRDSAYRIPIFSAGGLSDPLFPQVEHLQMANRILSEVPTYPIEQYYGDYMHFVQDKEKEWADICGSDHHVCSYPDYPNGDLNATPPNLVRQGITTRLDRFIDHYAQPPGDASEPQPPFDVSASLQVCPENASVEGVSPDEPGETFTAANFWQLAPSVFNVDLTSTQTTTNVAEPNPHGASDDPLQLFLTWAGKFGFESSLCAEDKTPAGPGVATYDSQPLTRDQTMIGATRLSIDYSTTSDVGNFQLDARLYDVFPDGSTVMVDRGAARVTQPSGTLSYELNGNAWRFHSGHQIRVEIAQDATPTYRPSDVASTTTITSARLALPVREGPLRRPLKLPRPSGPVSLPPLSWSPKQIDHGDGMRSISCPSLSLCVAIDDAGNMVLSSEPAGTKAWKHRYVDAGNTLLSISCPSASLCVAGDDAGNVITSRKPTGGAKAWTVSNVDGASSPDLYGLSCASESLCAAVDAAGNILTSSHPTGGAGAWSSASVDAHALTGVSCASSTLCVAVDDEGGVLSSTDPTGGSDAWTLSPVDGSAVLVGVSCPSESLCVAVDASGNVLTSTSPTAPVWSTAAVDNAANNVIYSVSCASTSLCVAVDDAGNILTSTNPTGGAAAWALGNVDPNPLNGVSCLATTLCVAVDSRGYRIAGSS